MKKFLIIAAVLTAFSLQAGDAVIPQLGKAKAQQEQLTAKKRRGGSVRGWYTAIGHCNVRYGPGENYGIAFTVEDGEPLYVIGRVGNWYKLANCGGATDNDIYYTHVQNLRRYRGPITWG
jgi:uncharacterized protein YgiM (DUF1202 family)